MPAPYPTVLERLSEHAASQPPDKKVWSFLSDRLEIADSYTYAELDSATAHLAAYLLKDCKIAPGERVLLVFFPGLAFTASLLACFKAGIVGVPVFPPDPRKLQKDLHHFVSIQKSSGAAVVLTHTLYDYAKKVSGIKSIFSGIRGTWPDLRWVSVDDILAKSRSKPLAADMQQLLDGARGGRDPHATAFLQYTSGSTSDPKGVMITHANLGTTLMCTTRYSLPSPLDLAVTNYMLAIGASAQFDYHRCRAARGRRHPQRIVAAPISRHGTRHASARIFGRSLSSLSTCLCLRRA